MLCVIHINQNIKLKYSIGYIMKFDCLIRDACS